MTKKRAFGMDSSPMAAAIDHLTSAAAAVQQAAEEEWTNAAANLSSEWKQLEDARHHLQEKEAAFEGERTRLEEAEHRMRKHAKLGDVVELNIGGQAFVETRRSTLCQFPDSMLHSLFCGRWEDQVTRDTEGRVFLDFSPDVFLPVLRCLRERQLAEPGESVSNPAVPVHAVGEFNKMLRFLGLSRFWAPWSGWTWNPDDKGCAVLLAGNVVRNSFTPCMNSLIRTKEVITHDRCEFMIRTLKRDSGGQGHHALGIATADAPHEIPEYGPGEHFWGLYLDGSSKIHDFIVQEGVFPTRCNHEAGTTYHMRVDMEARKLFVSINGSDFFELFAGLPQTAFHPALAVGAMNENAYELLV
eukprot:TRINITY_DN91877_c0_g1_i1.p1 TRINITY_DN91877_c0_g1~~TRINITY_DN91877_c0_g1_i1.p1  ORF type:complete len:383 (-),score=50.02 TRINITY_DN91877_c0_g1_i1:115-1185(-)